MQNIVGADHDLTFFALLAPIGQDAFELVLSLFFRISKCGCLLEVLRFNGCLFFDSNRFDLFLDILDIWRTCHRIDARTCSGFIHDVNRLVGKKSPREIAVGKLNRGFQCFIRQARLVMCLIFRSQAFENLHRLFHGWCFHLHRLKAPFQSRILLDVLPVFIQSCCTDTLKFASAECRLNDIGRIHCALGRSRANDSMQLIDEEDHILRATNFVHHRLDALLELSTILRPSYHESQIQSNDSLIAQ